MTIPLLDEAPCDACVRNAGLCRFHEKAVLPQLAEPSWPKMIGEGYVCANADCRGHLDCLERPGAETPRAGCQCHACGQTRAHRKHARAAAPSKAALRADRRNQRKAARAASSASSAPVNRLARATFGAFTRSRRSVA